MQHYPQQPQQASYQQSLYPQQPIQQGDWQTPPQSLPRKPRRWPWFVALLVAFLIGYGAGNANHTDAATQQATPMQQATQAPVKATQAPVKATQAPAHTPRWAVTHTYSSSGIKKTEVFTVSDDWKLQWTCDPNSFDGGQYNVIVTVYGSDGSMQDVAINDMCKSGNTSGATEEHSGGQVYLDVNSEGSWNITIQELK